MAQIKKANHVNKPQELKPAEFTLPLPTFIQYTLAEIQERLPEVSEYFFNQFQLKQKNISDALNLISKEFENEYYEFHQYVTSEYPDVFIFKLKR